MSREVFRSPVAVVVWWIWVLFAVGNLIDIALRGRDHLSLVAAFVLIAVTGLMYAGAQRPRLIADSGGLTIVNPLRGHRVGWAAVTAIDTTDLLRVRCEWLAEPGGERRQKAIYAWAVGASSRRQAFASMRGDRKPSDAEKIVTTLRAQAAEARPADPPTAGPASTWSWPAVAIAGLPVLALLVVLAV